MFGLFSSSKDSHLSNAASHAAKAAGHLAFAAVTGAAACAFGALAVASIKATMAFPPAYFFGASAGFVAPTAIMARYALEHSIEAVSEAFSAGSEVCNATVEGVYSVKDAFTDAFSSSAPATDFDAKVFVHTLENKPGDDWTDVVPLGESDAAIDAAAAA